MMMFLYMQGTSTNVPRYLRAEGQINNKKMNRQELEELVVGFWEFRTVQIAQRGGGKENTENALDELLYSYLLQRNDGQEMAAIEDGYNLQVCVHVSVHVCVCLNVCALLWEGICGCFSTVCAGCMPQVRSSNSHQGLLRDTDRRTGRRCLRHMDFHSKSSFRSPYQSYTYRTGKEQISQCNKWCINLHDIHAGIYTSIYIPCSKF